jgi:drug/metabolite transporter (DMT)-like permease
MTATVTVKPISFVLILVSVALAISGQICLRRGMDKVKKNTQLETGELLKKPLTFLKEVSKSYLVILGLLLFVSSAAFWLIVLADVPLGLAYPFVSLTYIVVVLYDKYIDKTYDIKAWNWLGVAAIVLGVILISLGRMSKS